MDSTYIWLAINALICWGLLGRCYNPKRKDIEFLPLVFGFLPACGIFAAGLMLVTRH